MSVEAFGDPTVTSTVRNRLDTQEARAVITCIIRYHIDPNKKAEFEQSFLKLASVPHSPLVRP